MPAYGDGVLFLVDAQHISVVFLVHDEVAADFDAPAQLQLPAMGGGDGEGGDKGVVRMVVVGDCEQAAAQTKVVWS
jgi:hypothetical protein